MENSNPFFPASCDQIKEGKYISRDLRADEQRKHSQGYFTPHRMWRIRTNLSNHSLTTETKSDMEQDHIQPKKLCNDTPQFKKCTKGWAETFRCFFWCLAIRSTDKVANCSICTLPIIILDTLGGLPSRRWLSQVSMDVQTCSTLAVFRGGIPSTPISTSVQDRSAARLPAWQNPAISKWRLVHLDQSLTNQLGLFFQHPKRRGYRSDGCGVFNTFPFWV